jgi:hypothetical protein
MRALSPLLMALGLAATGACFTPVDDSACRTDGDCAGAVCSNIGECAGATYKLRVAWTLRGATANTPGACDGIDELDVIVSDPSLGAEYSNRPVRCTIGSMLFDKLPLSFGTVAVVAYGLGGEVVTSAVGSTDPDTGQLLQVDLDLRF